MADRFSAANREAGYMYTALTVVERIAHAAAGGQPDAHRIGADCVGPVSDDVDCDLGTETVNRPVSTS